MKRFLWISVGICIFLGGLAYEMPIAAVAGVTLVVLLLIGGASGKKTGAGSAGSDTAKGAQPTVPPKVQVIWCESCGRQLPADAAFCGYCGARRG